MQFDPMALTQMLEKASPELSHRLTMLALGLVSPFNAHLKAELVDWKENKVQIRLKCHRGVKNHVGSIHAGALFTLGETCAGLIVIKNFSFKDYRPLMSEVSVKYEKQAREAVIATCEINDSFIKKAKKSLEEKEIPFIPMMTKIIDTKKNQIAEVKTVWQVKPWNKVRRK